MKTKIPNPGSDKAIEKGCECPVLDNSHGKGYMLQKNVFVMVEGCKLHGDAVRRAKRHAEKSIDHINET